MAAGKWIPELTASTPVTDAARLALAKRLEVVREYLQLALQEPDKDVEHVHQLRVGTRRASAALEIFRCCLPTPEYKRARKHLRQLRQAAGEARDWDVFLLGLGKQRPRPARQEPGWDFLTGYALSSRQSAQEHIRDSSPDFPFAFERMRAETVAAVQKPRSRPEVRTLLDLARPLLADLLQQLHDAMAGDLEDYPHLHQVRIAGKRLRYAMEVVAECFEPNFKEGYAAVEEMQEILGDVNDSQVACQRLAEHLQGLALLPTNEARRFKPAIQGLIRHHARKREQGQARFREWLNCWQSSKAEEKLWQMACPAEPLVKLHDDGSAQSMPASEPEGREPASPLNEPAQA